MLARSGGVLILAAGAFVASAAAEPTRPPSANALTPDGAATLWSPWLGGQTLEGLSPEVLTGVRVAVAAGGGGGLVRVRVVADAYDPASPVQVGQWVDLPAQPGTYTLAAPHVRYDYRDAGLGIDQRDGGHAIVRRESCAPRLGDGADPCQIMALQVHRPVLGDTAFPRVQDAAEVLRGEELAVVGVAEADDDGDLLGDQTEDRTDLRTSARVVRRAAGAVTLEIAVANAGPLSADLPVVHVAPARGVGLGTWSRCGTTGTAPANRIGHPTQAALERRGGERDAECGLPAVPVGATGRVRVTLPDVEPQRIRVSATAEGPDRAPGDNGAMVRLDRPIPAIAVSTDARVSLTKGIRATVTARRAGPVAVSLRADGRTVARRTVTVPAGGRRTVTLRLGERAAQRLLGRTAVAVVAATRTHPAAGSRTHVSLDD